MLVNKKEVAMDRSLCEFGREMAHMMPKFMQAVLKRMSNPLSAGNISVPQMVIMSFLREKDRSKMVDIAKALSVTTSAVTGHIDRMARLNLVKRAADEDDRRVINIEMTEKGKKIVDNMEKMRHKILMELFSRLTPIERKRYLETIKKLYHILTEDKK